MELPVMVLCEKCGEPVPVPRQSIDENAWNSQLRGFDQEWRAGFDFTFDCPKCGRRTQRLQNASE